MSDDELMRPNPELGLLNPEVPFFDLTGLDDEQTVNLKLRSGIGGLVLPEFVDAVTGFSIDGGIEWNISSNSELVHAPKTIRRLSTSVTFNPERISEQPGRPAANELQVAINLNWNKLDLRYVVDMYQLSLVYPQTTTILLYPNFNYASPKQAVVIANGSEYRRGFVYLHNGELDYVQSRGNITAPAPDREKTRALAEFKFASEVYNEVLQPVVGLLREQVKNAPQT